MIVGTIGGGAHLEFAVIGDTVNVAARIEQLTKETGDAILISDATRARARGIRARPRGEVPLRGRVDPVRVHAIGVPKEPKPSRPRAPSAG